MMLIGDNRPIGIFDSGVGGLTVVRSITKELPNENIIYFGDTARVPYGNKSRSIVTRFAHEITDFLVKNNVKIVVVACNTASSLSLESLRRKNRVPIIGVIKPGAREAVRISQNKRIGVIGTKSTIFSKSYDKELTRLAKGCKLFSHPCPLFVPLVENRFLNGPITERVARQYLEPFKTKGIDTLILGCTHYPILKTVIKKVMGKVRLVDSSYAVTIEVKRMLNEKALFRSRKARKGEIKYFVSDDVEGFRESAEIFLKDKIKVQRVVL